MLVAVLAIAGLVAMGAGCETTKEESSNTTSSDSTTTQTTTSTPTKTSEEDSNTYMDITVAEAKDLIDTTPELVILDVSNSYKNGHIPGAINYYVGDGSLDEAIPSLDQDVPYLVYCHVDSASISGAEKLIEAGFEKVYRLEGNYSAWVDAGYEVEK